VTPLKNPDLAPILFELTLAVDPDDAFNAFTSGFGDWWPTDTHSISKKDCITVEFNDGVGGEIIERAKGQDDIPWGRVRSWQPGEHVLATLPSLRSPLTLTSLVAVSSVWSTRHGKMSAKSRQPFAKATLRAGNLPLANALAITCAKSADQYS